MRNKEYDRFGPWIIEISEQDPLPPLFINHVTRQDEAIMSFKIPRNIERRNANPGWNLYDYVINLYEEDFQIWKRIDSDVITDIFKYNEITCIKHKEVLLSGELTIIFPDKKYSFNYSTVSSEIIRRMVSILRARYNSDAGRNEITPPKILNTERHGFYFSNLIKKEFSDNPANRLMFSQERAKLNSYDNNILKKIFHSISAAEIMECIHFYDGKEFKLTGRGCLFRNILHPVYGKEDAYFPVKHLLGIEKEPENSNNILFSIQIEGCSVETAATVDNPAVTEYMEILQTLCS